MLQGWWGTRSKYSTEEGSQCKGLYSTEPQKVSPDFEEGHGESLGGTWLANFLLWSKLNSSQASRFCVLFLNLPSWSFPGHRVLFMNPLTMCHPRLWLKGCHNQWRTQYCLQIIQRPGQVILIVGIAAGPSLWGTPLQPFLGLHLQMNLSGSPFGKELMNK